LSTNLAAKKTQTWNDIFCFLHGMVIGNRSIFHWIELDTTWNRCIKDSIRPYAAFKVW
jgi:hypothetical protein